eukprot:8162531-Pyramimonas_sp.AAC.1
MAVVLYAVSGFHPHQWSIVDTPRQPGRHDRKAWSHLGSATTSSWAPTQAMWSTILRVLPWSGPLGWAPLGPRRTWPSPRLRFPPCLSRRASATALSKPAAALPATCYSNSQRHGAKGQGNASGTACTQERSI